MAISTYSELQTAVANWLHEDTFTSIIPDFITIGEATLNRRLRLLQMETTSAVSTNTTDRFAALPADFLEIIDLALYADNYPQIITQIPLSKINDYALDESGLPETYAISSNIIYNCISDQVYTGVLRYYAKLDIATDSTNFLLTAYPDAYLYSALVASAPYIADDSRIGTWATLLNNALTEIIRADARSRAKSMLMVDAGLRQSIRSDIFTDA